MIKERREKIAELLLQKDKVKVRELAELFQVSTETIRKDLLALEADGLIRKNKGSAQMLTETSASRYEKKAEIHVEQKRDIAQLAVQYIPENATIFLDAGSTCYQLARQLLMRKDVCVITNFYPIADLLKQNDRKVLLIGGEIRPVSKAATGMLAMCCIEKLHADIAFVGASGIYDAKGPCVENFPEAQIKLAMMDNADKSILLADSSKMEVQAMVRFALWEQVDMLLTDKKMSADKQKMLAERVQLICAEGIEE